MVDAPDKLPPSDDGELQTIVPAHKETLRSLDDLATEAVNHYRTEGRLSHEELKALQEKKLQSLAPERRLRVDSVRTRITELDGQFRETTDGYRLQSMRFRTRAANLEEYGQKVCAEYHEEAEELQKRTDQADRLFAEARDIGLKEAWQDAEGGESAEVDPFTGLHTKEALMQRLSKKSVEAVNANDPKKLVNVEIRAGDMNNFKQGNDILGHQGFDDLLQKEFAARFMAMSAYLGSGEYSQQMDEETINGFFPPESALRQRLDHAKGKMKIDLYRQKAGADEIYTVTEYSDDVSDSERDELRILSEELVNDVFNSVIIGKHKPEELSMISNFYDNSPNYFKLKPAADIETGDVLMSSEEAEFWNKFGDGLRLYIQSTGVGRRINSDSETQLRLSADMSKPHNLSEGIRMLSHGTGLHGEIDKTQRQGTVTEGKLNIKEFSDNVYKSVNRRVSAVGLSSEEEMEELVRLGVANMAVGLLLQRSMEESEDISKPQGKRDLLVDAWTGSGDNPSEDAYNVGSLISVGRLVPDITKPEAGREVYQRTLDVYKPRVQAELGRMTSVLNENGWRPGQDVIKPLVSAFREGKVDYDLLRFYDKVASVISNARDNLKRQANIGSDSDEEIEPEYPAYLAEMPRLPDGIDIDDFRQALTQGVNPRFRDQF